MMTGERASEQVHFDLLGRTADKPNLLLCASEGPLSPIKGHAAVSSPLLADARPLHLLNRASQNRF